MRTTRSRERRIAEEEAAMRARVTKFVVPRFATDADESRAFYYAHLERVRAANRERKRAERARKKGVMNITRKAVRSSNIRSVGHDPKTNEVHVEFHSGDVWKYPGVSAAEHKAFVSAPSVGSYFHEHIKPLGGDRIQ